MGSGANETRSEFEEVIEVSKILTIVGLVLVLVFTIPYLAFMVLWEMALIYRDKQERPDAVPPTKDEWKVM